MVSKGSGGGGGDGEDTEGKEEEEGSAHQEAVEVPKVGAEGGFKSGSGGGTGLGGFVPHRGLGCADVELAGIDDWEVRGKIARGMGARHVDEEAPMGAVEIEVGIGAERRELLRGIDGPNPGLRS